MNTNLAACSFSGVCERVEPCQEVGIGFKELICSCSCWNLGHIFLLVPSPDSPDTDRGAP